MLRYTKQDAKVLKANRIKTAIASKKDQLSLEKLVNNEIVRESPYKWVKGTFAMTVYNNQNHLIGAVLLTDSKLFNYNKSSINVNTIVLKESYRNKGLSGALLKQALTMFIEGTPVKYSLIYGGCSSSMIPYYEKLGFSINKYLPNGQSSSNANYPYFFMEYID